ncbi:sirohydrochlorin cobaltochelatase [Bacteroides fluxus]|uniref:Cobalt chelatase n=1 Tax=Bacteroides fluxus YIT 12057 TaxID=763034 RepID=F3PUD4_9BACE|nr:sirohydrochlorin cobaltochelatase [Bacteroides fluxus]EGF56231.1 cobalt chelatase [Bacteroides fluxus YIT 12057]
MTFFIRTLLFFTVYLFPIAMAAQNKVVISGTFTDKQGNPLPLVTIAVENSSIGYQTIKRTVSIQQSKTIDFILEENAVALKSIEVYGKSQTQKMKESALAVNAKSFHVSTIEGYPTLEATLLQLKENRVKAVTLVPLLLVCGNHTKEDIAGVWKTELEKQGYRVNVRMQGLGENKAIRRIYIEHIKAMLND